MPVHQQVYQAVANQRNLTKVLRQQQIVHSIFKLKVKPYPMNGSPEHPNRIDVFSYGMNIQIKVNEIKN